MNLSLRLLLFGMLILAPGRALSGPITTLFSGHPQHLFGGHLETTGTHTPTETYANGVITLDPVHVADQLTPSTNFMQILLTQYPASSGWSFVNSASELSDDSLVVRTYYAFGATHMVGAMVHIQFEPHSGDPTHSTHDIHWIQVVTDNHNMTDNPGHGNPENTVDINEGINHHTTPYYDEGFTANAGQFGDRSDRWDGDAAHSWAAELFLVTVPKDTAHLPQEVTIHSGALWGWTNTVGTGGGNGGENGNPAVPEPTSGLLLACGLAGLGMRRRLT